MYIHRIIFKLKPDAVLSDVQRNIESSRLFPFEAEIEEAKKRNMEKRSNAEDFFINFVLPTLSVDEQKLAGIRVAEFDRGKNAAAFYAMLEKRVDKDVEYVQKDELNSYYYPNDPFFPAQYNLSITNIIPAWNLATGNGIRVAVIDGGTDYNHGDISSNIWRNAQGDAGYDFSSNDNNPIPDGDIHGTHVAGIIAATYNNNLGIAGVAPNCSLMTYKIFPNAWDSVAANAIYRAMKDGAHIINNSWGKTYQSPMNYLLNDVINVVNNKGVFVVFAAGNSNDNVSNYAPSNHPAVISVGNTNNLDQRESSSNYGSMITVSAPGYNIMSLRAFSNGYINMTGTSMSAPHVSGLIALLLSMNKNFSKDQIIQIIRDSADPITTDKPIGGRINIGNALLMANTMLSFPVSINVTGMIHDDDGGIFDGDEECPINFNVPLTFSPNNHLQRTGPHSVVCDGEVEFLMDLSIKMDQNRQLEFTGNCYLLEGTSGGRSPKYHQPFSGILKRGTTDAIFTNTLRDNEGDWISVKIVMNNSASL
jgi:thermitase